MDPINGPFKTLEKALAECEPFTTIYLSEGVYTCPRAITKPGIIVQKRDIEKEVYLLANEGPVLKVMLEQDDYIVFKDITIMHSGMCMEAKFKENAPILPRYTMEASSKAIREFEITPQMDCICFIKSGGIMFRNCKITLKSLKKKLKSRIPMIISMPKTFINLTSCTLTGNEENHNAACILINSDVFISDTKFVDFHAGAIYCLANPDNKVEIQDSKISNCKVMGIFLQGEGAKQLVQRVRIENVLGPGIKIAKGNYSKIKGCEVTRCQCGVHVQSAQPHILMNTFSGNYENGIFTDAQKGRRCDALIEFNKMEKNKQNGILCKGYNNHTKISRNLKISNNSLVGVKAVDGAVISVSNNTISYNFGQGVLLVESTHGHIEKNLISSNYKANLAFGGASSCDTVVIRNEIKEGRAEGIFMIESGFAWIFRNEIVDNADGIVLFDSTPHISGNSIEHNQRSGITCSGCSFPKIERNKIFGNVQSGINFRDQSRALAINNEIFSNFYEISARNYKKKDVAALTDNNEIEGDLEVCSNCTIF